MKCPICKSLELLTNEDKTAFDCLHCGLGFTVPVEEEMPEQIPDHAPEFLKDWILA